MKAALALVAGALVATASAPLPPPTLRVRGYLRDIAAAGRLVAVATAAERAPCLVRVGVLARNAKQYTVTPPSECGSETDTVVDEVWLGRNAVAVTTYDSPSPHGESFALWTGPLPRGPMRQRGEWGWTDSDPESPSSGCDMAVVSGGGLVAFEEVPNTLAVDHDVGNDVVCRAAATSKVTLIGATTGTIAVPGRWLLLATDGKRIVLARITANGARTGEITAVNVHGARVAAPPLAPSLVKGAFRAKLAPDGIVVETVRGIAGPGWSLRGGNSLAVAEGRVFYVRGRTVRVRRVRGALDRALVRIADPNAVLAAGSFGLAIGTHGSGVANVRRIGWATIDRVLARR